MSGRLVRVLANISMQPEGEHTLSWDGRNDSGTLVAPGTYFLRIASSQGHPMTQRVTVVR